MTPVHVVARILAVAYVALAVFGAVVYVQSGVNFVNVTEVVLNMEEHIRIVGVEILWSGNPSDRAEVRVFMNATNPGRITIDVFAAEFVLHMDDVYDLRPWYDPAKLDRTEVAPGGFNFGVGHGYKIPPGGHARLESVVIVDGGTERMNRFRHPDDAGLYHPIMWAPGVAFTFVEFDIIGSVDLPPYYEARGVMPHG